MILKIITENENYCSNNDALYCTMTIVINVFYFSVDIHSGELDRTRKKCESFLRLYKSSPGRS